MISVDAYLVLVFGGLLAIGVAVLILGLRQKEDAAEGHDVPAE